MIYDRTQNLNVSLNGFDLHLRVSKNRRNSSTFSRQMVLLSHVEQRTLLSTSLGNFRHQGTADRQVVHSDSHRLWRLILSISNKLVVGKN